MTRTTGLLYDDVAELWGQLSDLMDSLDVVMILEEHVPDNRRYLVDQFRGQVAMIDRFLEYHRARQCKQIT